MKHTGQSSTTAQKTIALNRKARHEYALEERFEAGIVLEGWEVKSIRAGRVQISDSYVLIKKGEAWLIGAQTTPLASASVYGTLDPTRSRKLLLKRKQLNTLIGQTERKGYTLIPLGLYWKKNRVKLEIALAKGKKHFDKRETEKDRDWQKERQRLFKKKT